jgi:hypothetical protein
VNAGGDYAADPLYSPQAFDTDTEITVQVVGGDDQFETVTEADMLNGANGAMLGNEVIQYRDATDNMDGTWTFGHLLRGRRGTEAQSSLGHGAGSRFVALSPATTQRITTSLDYIGVIAYYRALSIGSSTNLATIVPLSYQANALKPYAVAHLLGSRDVSNNITATWKRRTRVGGERDWVDYVTDVPINEDAEEYEVDWSERLLFGAVSATTLEADRIYDAGNFGGTAFMNQWIAKENIAQDSIEYRIIVEKISTNEVRVDRDWLIAPVVGDTYAVDGGTLGRTETGITAETADYTSGEQTTDGVTLGRVIWGTFYQMSGAVGRGFPSRLAVFP